MNSDPNQPNEQTPAPSETPVVPTNTPIESTTPVVPVVAKPSNKKLVILLSAIIGGLLVLGGAAFLIYTLFFAVTKADYQAAFDQVTVVRKDYSAGSGVSSSSSEESLAKTKTAFADFKTEHAKLASLKALKADKDLKLKYDAYETKAKEFITFGDSFIPSVSNFVDATNKVKKVGSSTSIFTVPGNIQKVIDIYKAAEVTDPTIKAYLDSTIATYTEIMPQAEIYNSATATRSEKTAAITKMSDSLKDLTKAGTTLTKDLKERTDAVKLTDQLNDLGKAVTAKLNDAK